MQGTGKYPNQGVEEAGGGERATPEVVVRHTYSLGNERVHPGSTEEKTPEVLPSSSLAVRSPPLVPRNARNKGKKRLPLPFLFCPVCLGGGGMGPHGQRWRLK